ncbi:uncharacterized protein LACBIDRAFT_297615 [Laccaria bicolor S238N-H82]|uniref:Predicted protein n=1 Tax=Laccaria bicolor (strain S238N-H82 / ATCC MYA-4686) TaxID=486041 RepID=B0DBL5_LACBS|nr:uncharacterized protein LACBIDRAFT_297615 [Laccaria bicolor S238N-H82]EDR08204.1 predicted protein [Laccaria bicolor S238N-H82]|eukprot:XP_001881274.1 predicted protein [Laccaria bicolor S238N-H82]
MRAGPVNTRGFPSLPVELLLEVTSHLLRGPIPSYTESVYRARYLAHHDTLRSLSQTCRSLRSIFLPHVWRRIEVCASKRLDDRPESNRKASKRISKEMATELVRQLEIVTIRDPTLAQYVQVVNVNLQTFCYDTVLAELARCLTLFPNLRTLQLLGLAMREGMIITHKVFKGLTFPQIRILVVPSAGYRVLRACPNVKDVTCIGGCLPEFWKTLFAHCPNVVSLGTPGGTDCAQVINVIAQQLPNLEKITFDMPNQTLTPETISNLSAFKRLHTVCFCFNKKYHLKPHNTDWYKADLMRKRRAVMAAFQNIPQRDGIQKRLIVKKHKHRSEVYMFDATLY